MLVFDHVSVFYGGTQVLRELSFSIQDGEQTGLIGANGAGKSTFLKLLSGELETQKGDIILDKNERMSVLKQDQNAYNDEAVLRTVMLPVYGTRPSAAFISVDFPAPFAPISPVCSPS